MITAAAFVVLAGGGALARAIGRAVRPGVGAGALATMLVNLSGAFALALVVANTSDRAVITAVGVGGLGAYTTFSTMISDTLALTERGRRLGAGLYLTATLLGGVLLADLGLRLGA